MQCRAKEYVFQRTYACLPILYFKWNILAKEKYDMKRKDRTTALSREFQNLLDDIEKLLEEAAALTGDEFSMAKEKIEERVAAAKETVVELGDDLGRCTRKTSARINHDVHEEPWKAIGIGTAVGLMLGMLFTRR